jgi:hypothetical protein
MATFFVLFAVCLAMVLHDGRATRLDYSGAPANSRIAALLPKLGVGDPHNYLRAGHNIAQEQGIPSESSPDGVADRRVLNLWPPGMPLYYAALFTLFGPDMPVGVVAAATMAMLWALLLTAYVDLLARYLHWAAIAAMIGLVLLSDITQDWILGSGVFWSEGLYIWCVLAALYAATRSSTARSERSRLGWAGATGVLLGLSAYVRSISDLLGWLMIAVLVGWGALTVVRRGLHRRQASRGDQTSPAVPTWHKQLLGLLVCAVAFQIVTTPWRIYAAENLRPGNYTWSTEAGVLWRGTWVPDRMLVAQNLKWLLAGGPNTPCKVDQSTCEEIAAHELRQQHPYSGEGRYTTAEYRRLAILALANHPLEYGADRLRYLRTTWFWKTTDRTQNELVQNGLLAAAVVGALVLSIRRVRRVGPDLVALLFPGLAVASMLPFVFVHFEARYFFPVKLVAVVSVFVLLAVDPRRVRTGSDLLAAPPAESP